MDRQRQEAEKKKVAAGYEQKGSFANPLLLRLMGSALVLACLYSFASFSSCFFNKLISLTISGTMFIIFSRELLPARETRLTSSFLITSTALGRCGNPRLLRLRHRRSLCCLCPSPPPPTPKLIVIIGIRVTFPI